MADDELTKLLNLQDEIKREENFRNEAALDQLKRDRLVVYDNCKRLVDVLARHYNNRVSICIPPTEIICGLHSQTGPKTELIDTYVFLCISGETLTDRKHYSLTWDHERSVSGTSSSSSHGDSFTPRAERKSCKRFISSRLGFCSVTHTENSDLRADYHPTLTSQYLTLVETHGGAAEFLPIFANRLANEIKYGIKEPLTRFSE